jgi:hypothetical protein
MTTAYRTPAELDRMLSHYIGAASRRIATLPAGDKRESAERDLRLARRQLADLRSR